MDAHEKVGECGIRRKDLGLERGVESGFRFEVFLSATVRRVPTLALQQEELAVVGERHRLHQLGQCLWVL